MGWYASHLEGRLLARRIGRWKDRPCLVANGVEVAIGAARLVMEQPQAADAVRGGELGALAPVTVSPSPMLRPLLRREVRVEDDGGGAGGELRERLVEVGIAELVVGRVNEVPRRPLDPIRQTTVRMIQRRGGDGKTGNRHTARAHHLD